MLCVTFHKKKQFFYNRTTLWRLSTTTYSVYSQLPSTSGGASCKWNSSSKLASILNPCHTVNTWDAVWNAGVITVCYSFISLHFVQKTQKLWKIKSSQSTCTSSFSSMFLVCVYRLCSGMDDRSSIPGRSNDKIFSFCHHCVPTGSGAHTTQTLIQWVPGGSGWSVKLTAPLPSSAEVKNAWSCTSTLRYVFMAWCLVKHRDDFVFSMKSVFVWIRTCLALNSPDFSFLALPWIPKIKQSDSLLNMTRAYFRNVAYVDCMSENG